MASVYIPIAPLRSSGLGFPLMDRGPEAASKTFKIGVPLSLVSGYLQETDFATDTIVHSFSSEQAHNLTAAGTAQDASEGTPINQPNAKITPVGAWIRDGLVGYYAADGKSTFLISLKDGQTFSQALVTSGALYGLTKDGTTGLWYLDTADTAGANAVLRVVGPDPTGNTTRVEVQVDATKRFFN